MEPEDGRPANQDGPNAEEALNLILAADDDDNDDKPRPPPTPIPQLPFVPLQVIFEHLYNKELYFTVPLVTPQWHDARQAAGNNRHHLSLCVHNADTFYRNWTRERFPSRKFFFPPKDANTPATENDLHFPGSPYSQLAFPKLTASRARQLIRFYPHIKHLQIADNLLDTADLRHYATLLLKWSTTLTSLRLWFWTAEPTKPKKQINLWILFKAINSCARLQTFTFYFNNTLWADEIADETGQYYSMRYFNSTLTHLKSLKMFQFSTQDDPSRELLPALFACCRQANELETVEIANPVRFEADLTAKLGDAGCLKLRSLRLRMLITTSDAALQVFTTKARNLVSLELDYGEMIMRLDACLQSLQALPQLEVLKIIGRNADAALRETVAAPAEGGEEADRLQFSKLLELQLNLQMCGHDFFHYAPMAEVFPRIERVELIHYLVRCHNGCYDNVYGGSYEELFRERLQCIEQMINPWLTCPTIKYVYIGPNRSKCNDTGEVYYRELFCKLEHSVQAPNSDLKIITVVPVWND